MPTLYFCNPHAKNQGMLRAVLSINECERVVSQHPATYVGDKFPKLSNEKGGGKRFCRAQRHLVMRLPLAGGLATIGWTPT